MTSNLSDRRIHPRYPQAAALLFNYDGQIYPGNVNDLGKGGLSFWAEVDLPVAEPLPLMLTLTVGNAQAKMTCLGLVRWKQTAQPELFRYGAAFSGLTPAQLSVLAEFLGGTGEPPMAAAG